MALTLISQPEYRIDTPGSEDLVYTGSSLEYLALPDAVRYATDRNSILQSASEAIAFRLAAQGAASANDFHVTRTAALYCKEQQQYFVAFDDDPAENILLARAQEGYDAHTSTRTWLVPRDDPHITAALARAHKSNRILPLPMEDHVCLNTARTGASAYGTNAFIRATIGDLAEPYARFLNENGYRAGYEWFLAPKTLGNIGVDDKHVEVRRVGVGGVGYDGIYGLGAGGLCDGIGRACGVRKISTGNKGDC